MCFVYSDSSYYRLTLYILSDSYFYIKLISSPIWKATWSAATLHARLKAPTLLALMELEFSAVPPPAPCPAHTTHTNCRWVSGDGLYLQSGTGALQRCVTKGKMRVKKDGENYWFGWQIILMWHNPCRELQTSAAQQCLVERCLSHPTSPCCTQSSWGSATLPSDFHPELYMQVPRVARDSKISFTQTSYGQSLDAVFPPPQDPKQSLSSRVWESLSFQHVRWELTLDDPHMDSESGCCAGAVLWLGGI